MKLWKVTTLCTASLLLLSGCGAIVPKPKEKQRIDPTLPVVTLTKSGMITDMKTVAFEWKSVADPRVEGIYVYKAEALAGKKSSVQYYDTIESRYATHYVDRDVEPNHEYIYRFRVFGEKVEGKNSQLFNPTTLPVLHSVSWIHSIGGLPRLAKILWRPHSSERVASYIIERKSFDDKQWDKIAELSGRLNAEYIDTGLEDNHVYKYRIKVRTYDDIVSTPSAVVKAITKPLPLSIEQVSATKNLPKEIRISWSPTKQKDFYRYYLYRSKTLDGEYELIAKLHNNHFVDKVGKDGVTYFYRVSVVDKDGLKSNYEKSVAMGSTLAKPEAPAIVEAKLLPGKIVLQWKRNDPRAVAYKIVKRSKKGWFDEVKKEFKGIRDTSFVDFDIAPDTLYSYTVYSIDSNNIVSKPSMEVKIQTPESKEFVAPKKREEAAQQVVAQPKEETKQQTSVTQEEQTVVAPTNQLDLNGL